MKISYVFLSTLIFLLAGAFSSFAADTLPILFFYSKTCPHCAKEELFLEKLSRKYPQIELISYEVSEPKSIEALRDLEGRGIEYQGYVPFTVIENDVVQGYGDDQTTGAQIEALIRQKIDVPLSTQTTLDNPNFSNITLPIFGSLNVGLLSLPVLAVVIGVLDGFNPCALWALLFLISLLLGMKSKKRMWLLGSVFILTSGLVYFLFMTAWFNFFLLLGAAKWVRVAIALIALGAGIYSLRDFWINKDGGCKSEDSVGKRKVFAKLKKFTLQKNLWIAFFGIIFLAVAVNTTELLCSAGLPAVFTSILATNNLSPLSYYLYIALYVFFFMIDDLFIFIVAMATLRVVGIGGRYARFSRLVGGLLMLAIGLLLIFSPQTLMFG